MPCVGFAATAAAAEDAPVRASLELAAPADCGARAQLISGITRRSERIRIASGVEARHVQVNIARDGKELAVVLTFQQPNGRRSTRTLRAPSCDEALEAAALVTALSLDPSASTAPERELPPAPTAPPDETEPAPATAPAPTAAPRGAQPPTSEDPDEADAAAHVRARWSVGVVLAASWQPAPAPMPGAGVSLMLRDERPNGFSPTARLTLAHFGRGGFSASSGLGEASFQVDSATLELCPVRVTAWRLGLAPCAFATGGVLRAAGFEALDTRRVTRPWWVFGGSALALLSVGETWQLEGGVSAGKPSIQDTFQFEPLVVHHVRPWVVTIGLGAGFVFR